MGSRDPGGSRSSHSGFVRQRHEGGLEGGESNGKEASWPAIPEWSGGRLALSMSREDTCEPLGRPVFRQPLPVVCLFLYTLGLICDAHLGCRLLACGNSSVMANGSRCQEIFHNQMLTFVECCDWLRPMLRPWMTSFIPCNNRVKYLPFLPLFYRWVAQRGEVICQKSHSQDSNLSLTARPLATTSIALSLTGSQGLLTASLVSHVFLSRNLAYGFLWLSLEFNSSLWAPETIEIHQTLSPIPNLCATYLCLFFCGLYHH